MGNAFFPPLPQLEEKDLETVCTDKQDTSVLEKVSIEEDTIEDVKSIRIIVINQATCYGCNTLLVDSGVCKCGNVEIYGGVRELGRRVKNAILYSDCSLLEYNRC